MINKEIYNLVIKADKEAENNGACGSCFCYIFKNSLEGSIRKHFLDWKAKNKCYTICGSVLFYLQDLGFIEILSGAYDRANGVRCKSLKYTIIKKNIQGNKI